MKICLSCGFDCVLEIDEKKYEMRKHISKVFIEIEKHEKVLAVVYPIEKNMVSYAFELDGEIALANSRMEIVKYNDDEFDIVLKPFIIGQSKVFKYNFSNKSKEYVLSLGALNILECKKDGKSVFFEFVLKVDSFKEYLFKDFVALHIVANTGEAVLVEKDEKFYFWECQDFLLNNSKISFVLDEKTIAGHGQKVEIDCGNFEIKKDLVYLKGEPLGVKAESLLPFAFFEAVKLKDIVLAKNYLSSNLKEIATQEMFESYFGDFKKIKPYNFHKDKGHYVCLCKNDNTASIFRIKTKDGKIEEIEKV